VNVPLYRKLGFEVSKKITLQRGTKEVHLDIMVREPVLQKKPAVLNLQQADQPDFANGVQAPAQQLVV
jgi:hypothetical protein